MEAIDYSKTSIELQAWFGMSPTFMTGLLGFYLLIVLKLGPSFMSNRPAYKLKTFMVIYNIIQLISCGYIILKIMETTSSTVFQFWQCTLMEENSRIEYLFNRVTYFIYWLKIVELIETVVFVLRKKQNQVSFLHVFHHCSTVTLIYCILKYYKRFSALYPVTLNSIVHIIMYSYYLTAAVCDKDFVKRLLPFKKSITTIQMIQFVLILVQAVVIWNICEVPRVVVVYYCTVVSVIFYNFYVFYKKNYTSANSSSRKK